MSPPIVSRVALRCSRTREPDLLRLLQKLVTCNGTPVHNMQRRVLVRTREGTRLPCFFSPGQESSPTQTKQASFIYRLENAVLLN